MQPSIAPSLAFAPLALAPLAFAVVACGSDAPANDARPSDASPTDVGRPSATSDAGRADSGAARDAGPRPDAGASDAGREDAGVACTYPAGAAEPMALGEVLSPYSWPVALENGSGRRIELDLRKVHCNDDDEVDWAMANSLLFVSVPAF